MNLDQVAQLSQIISTIIIGVGVVVSLYIGIVTLREAEKSRKQSMKPHVLFDHGGQIVKCEYKKGFAIPGFIPQIKLYSGNASEIRRISPTNFWGRLMNIGVGPAIGTCICMVLTKIHTSSGVTEINDQDLKCFPFHPALNTIPCSPAHLLPKNEGSFLRIPTPAIFEFPICGESFEGSVLIFFRDIYGKGYTLAQEVRVFIDRYPEPKLTITLGEQIVDFSSITNRLKSACDFDITQYPNINWNVLPVDLSR